MPTIFRIGLIDDNPIIRNVIKIFLKQSETYNFHIEFEYGSLLEIHHAKEIEYDPHIILLDIKMPDINGIEGIPILKKKYPKVHIIMLTDVSDLELVKKCIQKGALGYIKKSADKEEVISAIANVLHGDSYVSPSIIRPFFDQLRDTERQVSQLTNREKEIADAILEGLSYKLIADKHNISIDTVRTHIKSLYKKLNVNSKAELISILKI